MTRDHRRLAAIVSADVAGYSRLMGRDEGGTLARLKALRRAVIDPKVAEYGGRIVKSMGDGLLLEFASVVDAVRCAVDVQREMAAHNADLAADDRIDWRIGINVGDIIIDADDIYGDGVNVAARLQALAAPGGVCVSRGVRDQVLDKLSFRFEDLGAREVKNIARPVEAFRVRDERDSAAPVAVPGAVATARGAQAQRGSRWPHRVAAAVAALGIAGIATWMALRESAPPAGQGAAAGSVVVVPFSAAGTSAAEREAADALSRDVTGTLARSEPDRVVIAYGVAAALRGKGLDGGAIGREVKTRYFAEGEVRRVGERLEVGVRLVDTADARQVWNGRYELDPGAADDSRSIVERRIAQGLRMALSEADGRHAAAIPAKESGASALVARANALPGTDLKQVRESIRLLDEALRIDPNHVPALASMAMQLMIESEVDVRADHDRIVGRMDEVTRKAVELGDNDPFAWMVRGMALAWQGRLRPALEAYDKAQRLDPSRRSPYGWRAFALASNGRPDEALAVIGEARRIFGQPEAFDARVAAFTHLLAGRYDDAISLGETAAGLGVWYFDHVVLAAAYANKGDLAKATAAASEIQKLQPGYSIAVFKARKYSTDPAFLEQTERHLFPGLRKAGVPEP